MQDYRAALVEIAEADATYLSKCNCRCEEHCLSPELLLLFFHSGGMLWESRSWIISHEVGLCWTLIKHWIGFTKLCAGGANASQSFQRSGLTIWTPG